MPSELEQWVARSGASVEMQRMAARVDLESTLDAGELDKGILQIAQGILTAEDEDAVFAAANVGTTAGKDFLNVPFLLQGSDIQWKKSGLLFEEGVGFPWYCLMQVTDLVEGELKTLNCGGFTFVHTIYRLQEIEAFDKYTETGGMPLILSGKQSAKGTVVIPTKYRMPTVKNAAKTSK